MATKRRHYKPYTANEIAILKSTPSVKKCVRILKRTPQAIYSAKNRLGIIVGKSNTKAPYIKRVTTHVTKASRTTLDITDARSISVSKTGVNIVF